MPAEIVLQPSRNAAGLAEKRERLAAVRAALAEREADIAQLRSQLKAFEGQYLRRVGALYAELDEIAARITELEVALYDSDSARRRAQATHEAAFGADQEPEEFDPSPSLKTLFREVAKRIHPDFASDEAEQKHFTLLMTRANQAYSRGDAETLQRMLDDHLEVNAARSSEGSDKGDDEGDNVTLLRVARQIQHAERDIAALDGEQQTLLGSEIGQLYTGAEAAVREDRDLLGELEVSLRERIADAQYRLEFVERQVGALGR